MSNIYGNESSVQALMYVEKHSARFFEELTELCSFPSISGRLSDQKTTACWLEKKLKSIGANTEVVNSAGGVPIIFGEIEGISEQTLLIYNYYDVVSEGDMNSWDSPPFLPQIRDGRIYARGVDSNKGNLLSRIHAVESYLNGANGKPPITIKFLFEGEEEIGSPYLIDYFKKYKNTLSSDFCIWAGERKDSLDRFQISLGNKGAVYLELRSIESRPEVHSSLSTMIPNPALKLINALKSMMDDDGFYKLGGFYDQVVEVSEQEKELLSKLSFDEEKHKKLWGIDSFLENKTGLDLLINQYCKPSFTICGLQSGHTETGVKAILPNEAVAKIEFRLVPNQQAEPLISQIQKHLHDNFNDEVTCEVLASVNPSRAPLSTSIAEATYSAARKTSSVEPVILPSSSVSGRMSLANSFLKAPTISVGIGDNYSNPHGSNENISLESYLEGTRLMIILFKELAAYDNNE